MYGQNFDSKIITFKSFVITSSVRILFLTELFHTTVILSDSLEYIREPYARQIEFDWFEGQSYGYDEMSRFKRTFDGIEICFKPASLVILKCITVSFNTLTV